MKPLLVVVVIAATGCTSSEERARETRIAFRETLLTQRLNNDKLMLENDAMAQKRNRIAIDQYVIQQDNLAIWISKGIAATWGPNGNGDARRSLADLESKLDQVDEQCHAGALAAKTLKEAQQKCSEFEALQSVIAARL